MDAQELLRYLVEAGGSDLHLKAGGVPFVRVDGALSPTDFPVLTPEDTAGLAAELMASHKAATFGEAGEADFGYSLSGVGRFRINAFHQRGYVGLAIRRVRSEMPTFGELRLPPVVQTLADASRGLVLITGPAGTGKTTTITAMIGHINKTRRAHIVTIEDPIEVVHEDVLSIIDQREIGADTVSFEAALRSVVRQDPDVIFIGEIRDAETAESAIQAAETGHLVISTLHTIDATETVNRVIDLFPPSQQRQVRVSLAASLKGVLSQRLVRRADGKGRVPAVEVLIANGRVQERIVDPASTYEMEDIISSGEFYGMQSFDQSLVGLVLEGLVSEEDAKNTSTHPHDFMLTLRGATFRAPAAS